MSPNEEIRLLPVGTRVEVRNRFTGNWSRGFKVHRVDNENLCYELVRTADNTVLLGKFSIEDVRRERHSNNTWWVRVP